jgi:hypothetical protein
MDRDKDDYGGVAYQNKKKRKERKKRRKGGGGEERSTYLRVQVKAHNRMFVSEISQRYQSGAVKKLSAQTPRVVCMHSASAYQTYLVYKDASVFIGQPICIFSIFRNSRS